jgi:uncharacterized protein YlzI (FlbEa/FlbD family)
MKLREFTDARTGRAVRLNQEQISEIQVHPTENDVTVIWMSSGRQVEVRLDLQKVLAKLR